MALAAWFTAWDTMKGMLLERIVAVDTSEGEERVAVKVKENREGPPAVMLTKGLVVRGRDLLPGGQETLKKWGKLLKARGVEG